MSRADYLGNGLLSGVLSAATPLKLSRGARSLFEINS